jgi:molybdopterin-binding protein
VLLLDEPLSATDTKLRNELRSLLRHINKRGQTIIHVTHDFDEAVSLADHIAIMRMGQIIQTGTPQEVFGKPRNSFVAHFTGISNFFKAEIIQEESKCIAFIKPGIKLFSTENCESATASIIIRNNDIVLSAAQAESSALNNFEARIVDFYPSRNGIEVVVDAGIVLHAQISADSASRLSLQIGKSIWVQFKASSVKIIPD